MRLTKQFFTLAGVLFLSFASASVLAKTYRHDLGEVTLDKIPQRVVVLGFASLDLLNALDIDPVGLPKKMLPVYLSQYAAEKYTNTGSLIEVNYETLFNLKPDLIIAESRLAKIYPDLSEVAATYMFDVNGDDYWASSRKQWRTLGEIFDKQDQVENLIAQVQGGIDTLSNKSRSAPLTTLTVMNNGNNISMFGPESRFSFIYKEAGFSTSHSRRVNSTPHKHGDLISFEYIADAKPELLLILDREQAIGQSSGKARSLFNNALVNTTPAATNRRVVFLDPAAWYLAPGGFTATLTMLDDLKTAIGE